MYVTTQTPAMYVSRTCRAERKDAVVRAHEQWASFITPENVAHRAAAWRAVLRLPRRSAQPMQNAAAKQDLPLSISCAH
jgi:hypothetical protein